MIWFIVGEVASGYNIVTGWMLVNSYSGCFVPGNVSFDACAMVVVMVRLSFLKDGGKNTSIFCCESVAVGVTSKAFTVLTVGYCVRNKKEYCIY
jgi:hypothetical protein